MDCCWWNLQPGWYEALVNHYYNIKTFLETRVGHNAYNRARQHTFPQPVGVLFLMLSLSQYKVNKSILIRSEIWATTWNNLTVCGGFPDRPLVPIVAVSRFRSACCRRGRWSWNVECTPCWRRTSYCKTRWKTSERRRCCWRGSVVRRTNRYTNTKSITHPN